MFDCLWFVLKITLVTPLIAMNPTPLSLVWQTPKIIWGKLGDYVFFQV